MPQEPHRKGSDSGLPRELAVSSALGDLRNSVVMAASEDMGRRHADIRTCLANTEIGGTVKLKFAVKVRASPEEAEVSSWRFVEIVDGEALPQEFGSCAEREFGGPHKLRSEGGMPFPDMDGDLEVIYFLPPTTGLPPTR